VRLYKLGGPALEDPSLLSLLAEEVLRAEADASVVVVHGGGRRVERLLERLKIPSHFVGGRRATSREAMEVVEMVLSGAVNKELASGLTRAGVPAVGLSGRDAGLLSARLEPGLGLVGTPDLVNPSVVRAAWAAGLLPVISPVADGPMGEPINVNADEAALGLARALRASTLVYLSEADGVQVEGGLAETMTTERASRLIADGTISGGMVLKVRAALEAAATIPEVVIAGSARLSGGFPGTRVGNEASVEAGS